MGWGREVQSEWEAAFGRGRAAGCRRGGGAVGAGDGHASATATAAAPLPPVPNPPNPPSQPPSSPRLQVQQRRHHAVPAEAGGKHGQAVAGHQLVQGSPLEGQQGGGEGEGRHGGGPAPECGACVGGGGRVGGWVWPALEEPTQPSRPRRSPLCGAAPRGGDVVACWLGRRPLPTPRPGQAMPGGPLRWSRRPAYPPGGRVAGSIGRLAPTEGLLLRPWATAAMGRARRRPGHVRCPRCWRWVPALETNPTFGDVCPRCSDALKS